MAQPQGSLVLLNRNMAGTGAQSDNSLKYPSPFMDFEKHLLPESFKGVCNFLVHAFLTDPNINSGIENMSAYALTDFVAVDEEDEVLSNKWMQIIDEIDLKGFNLLCGLDHFLYGNDGESVYKPFKRHLVCKCGKDYDLSKSNVKARFKSNKFQVYCKDCKAWKVAARVYDERLTGDAARNKIGLIRWNIFDLDIDKHDFAPDTTAYYNVPEHVVDRIKKGDIEYINKTPISIVKATVNKLSGKTKKAQISLNDDEIKLIQRPMPSMPGNKLRGWGLPLAISALRDLFFKNVMRRAQAVLLHENIIPFRVFSPATAPSATHDGAKWAADLQKNYHAYKQDPRYAMITGVPINAQQVGGDGRALSLFAEMNLVNGDIIKSMGAAREFIEGGMSYSGGSVSLKILENNIISSMRKREQANNWIIKQIGEIIGLKPIKVKYIPFKTGDDIQTKQALLNLNGAGKISDRTLLKHFGLDAKSESKIIQEEFTASQKMQQVASAKAQMEAQKVIQYMQNTQGSVPDNRVGLMPPEQIDQVFNQLTQTVPPEQIPQVMQQLSAENPYLAKVLQERMENSPSGLINKAMGFMQQGPDGAMKSMEDLQMNDSIKAAMLQKVLESIDPYNMSGLNKVPGQPQMGMSPNGVKSFGNFKNPKQFQMVQFDKAPPNQKPPMRDHANFQ